MASYGAGVFMATLLCCMVQCREAKSIDVGGAAGWTSFESSQVTAPNYGAWAQSQKFSIGDTLVFKFAEGAHNVWLMKSLAAYQSCDFSGAALLDEGNSGYYTWTATQPGAFFFSCDKGAEGVGTHCNYNQKLAIRVSKTATTPTSAPPPAPILPPSPTPANAPSPSPVTPPAPVVAPSPTPVNLAPSPSPHVKAPAPVLAPSPAPVKAPSPSPVNPPPPASINLAPSPINWAPSPVDLAPSPSPSSWIHGPVAGPAGFPTLAPSPTLSPSPSSGVPAPAPSAASTPMALTPGTVSSSPLPEVPGGGPASDTSPASPNGAGVLRGAAQYSSSLAHSVLLLCVLLW